MWRKMLEARDEVEHKILWEMNRGSTNVRHENLTGLGALYHVIPPEFSINEELQEVEELRHGDNWNAQLIEQTFPKVIADHIIHEVHFDATDEYLDTPKWMPTTLSRFSVSNAWQKLSPRAPTNVKYKMLWTKGLPFKISFFLRRLWRVKIPTDDIWGRSGYVVVSKYWYCVPPQEDTFQHLFLMSTAATKVWKIFLQAICIVISMVQVSQLIRAWWNAKKIPKLKPLLQAAPAVITWEL